MSGDGVCQRPRLITTVTIHRRWKPLHLSRSLPSYGSPRTLSCNASTWCLRKLASRPAQYIYLCVLAIIIVPAITLRVEAALFERKVIATVRALSTLKVAATSEAEAVARMRALGPINRAIPTAALLCRRMHFGDNTELPRF
jgi:hypothetical protein